MSYNIAKKSGFQCSVEFKLTPYIEKIHVYN